ncbi:MAG: hypothetical protein HY049_03100 [Acidobacteria bacterium]|nr:hypothetical protein [Acidobacteriota bacterium]
MRDPAFASWLRRFRSASLPLVVALVAAAAGAPWTPAQTLPDPAATEGAIQKLIEERSREGSPLAHATAATYDSLNRILDLSRTGDSASMLLLEMKSLRVAYDELQRTLASSPAVPRGAFDAVEKVLDLEPSLGTSAGRPAVVARAVRRIQKAAESALRTLSREPAPPRRVIYNPVPEVRLDPVPLGAPALMVATPALIEDAGVGISSGTTITPDISALATQLGHDPLKIYQYVRNNFRFETYFGFLKGAQATLETKGGNDYDLAVLTGALLQSSGFNVRYGRGTAIIPAQSMIDWLGLEDAGAANSILNTAGISAVPVVNGSVIDNYRVDRLWVEVETAPRPGSPLAWVRLDPAFKKHNLDPGVPGILAAVPFDETTYLSVTRTQLTYEFYRDQVSTWLQTHMPGTSAGDVPFGMSVIPDVGSGLPRSLPYQLLTFNTIYTSIPSTLMHKSTIRVRYLGATQLSQQIILPDTSLQRITVSYRVNPSEQGIVNGFGGLANTPPGAVHVIPDLKLDGATLASGGLIPYLATVSVEIDFTKPGDVFDGTSTHTLRAGEWSAIGIDAYQISDAHLQRQAQIVVNAIALKSSGGTPDPDELIGAFLYLAIMEYHHDVRAGDEVLTGLAHYRQVVQVSEGAALANQQIFSVVGTPFTTLPGGLTVDVPRLNRTNFALNNDNTLTAQLRRIAGFNGSAQEHALWEGFLNVPGISTIKSLQIAKSTAIPVFVIDDTDSDPNNNCSVLCPQLTLDSTTKASIQADVASGRRVTVPKNPTPLNSWTGVGYITELPATGSAGYIISGGLASASSETSSGAVPPGVASGGSVTIILQDGTVLVVPIGLLGNGQGAGLTGDPVNIANGNFFRDETDFSIPALGEPLAFRRAYNSQSTFAGPLGIGWTHPYSDFMAPQPGGAVIWINAQGTAYTFAAGGVAGTYVSPPGLAETLTSSGGTYRLESHEGRVMLFDAAGKLTSRADRNGSTFTFGYDGSGRLATVTDPAARALTLTYGAGNRILAVSDFTGRSWAYGYDGGGRLALVTSPSNGQTPARVTAYAYDGAGRLISTTEPNGGVRQVRYYANGRVAQVIDPLGGAMSLVYNPFKSSTAVIDERGRTEIHEFNASGNPTAITHADGSVDRWTWASNLMQSHTDPLGATETFQYNADGNLTRGVDPTLRETTYEYAPTYSSVTKVTRPVGRQMVFAYDAHGNVQQVTDPGLKVRTQINNAQGLPSSVTDQRLVTTSLTYNLDGQLATRSRPLSWSETFAYNPRGTLQSATDPKGDPRSFTYDLLDRLLTTTDSATSVERRLYDAGGQLVQLTNVRGGVTTYAYDLLGRLTRQTNPDGSTRRFDYDAVGNLVADTDELGRTTRYVYDARNRCVRTTFADGGVAARDYDAAGRLIAVTDPLGNTTRSEHDAAGRLTRSVDALGHDILRAYDAAGNLDTVTDRRGGVTRFKYDSNLKIIETDGPAGQLETFDFDAAGHETERTRYDISGVGTVPPDPRTLPAAIKRRLIRTYDALGRVDTETDPVGGVTQFTYDAAGNALSVKDPRLNTSSYHYTAAGNLVDRVTQPDLGQSLIAYDAAGNRTQVTTPTGGKYKWTYDSRNRVSTQTDPLGSVTQYRYDLAGNVTQVLNPDGGWVKRSYDPVNRLRRTDRSDGSFTERIYDRAGNLVRASTDKTTLDLTYDALNRLTSETLGLKGTSFTKTVQYQYDFEGNLKNVTDPTARVLTYGYDLAGHLTSVASTTLGSVATITPDGYGQRGTVAYGNGRTGTFLFDKNGRPTSIDWTSPIAQFGYVRDPAGSPTSLTERLGGSLETLNITYDALNRPVVSTASASPGTRSESFAYDLNGNPTNPGAGGATTFNAANQAVAHAGTSYAYDAQGNRKSAIPTSGNTVVTTHDPENRIVSIVSGPSRTDITYDGLERPVQILQDGVTTRLVYAIQNRLAAFDGSGSAIARYTMSPRVDDVFAVESGANAYYAMTDAVGSVRAVTNGAGAVVGTRLLSLFGRQVATTGTPDVIPLGFGARPFYLGGALIDQRARLYDPALATFVSNDPLGVLSKFPNPYAYANNRPDMFVDPLGLSPEGPSLWNRVFGGLKAVGGLAEDALGILGLLAPEPTMLTKVGGVLLIGHGTDQLQAGLRQLWTGEATRTLTSQGLGAGAELLGFSENQSYYIGEFGDAGIGIVLSLGTTAGLQAATTAPRIGATGVVGETALKELGGESQVFFQTSQGARYVDQLVNGVANESKVGYTSLTQSVTTQIAKDAELIQSGKVDGAVWHFFTSPVTGQVGPSGPLLQALQNAGITVVIH